MTSQTLQKRRKSASDKNEAQRQVECQGRSDYLYINVIRQKNSNNGEDC
jgi:hypothetical protein